MSNFIDSESVCEWVFLESYFIAPFMIDKMVVYFIRGICIRGSRFSGLIVFARRVFVLYSYNLTRPERVIVWITI
jgi:hypothetical protein